MAKIRVLVVDDSLVARGVLIEGLKRHPNIEVVGFAINALDAKQKVLRLRPDVMTCDVQMPGMSGIDFLKELLPQYPVPTVLVSSLNLGVFDALHAGAVDFVRKQNPNRTGSKGRRGICAHHRDMTAGENLLQDRVSAVPALIVHPVP